MSGLFGADAVTGSGLEFPQRGEMLLEARHRLGGQLAYVGIASRRRLPAERRYVALVFLDLRTDEHVVELGIPRRRVVARAVPHRRLRRQRRLRDFPAL